MGGVVGGIVGGIGALTGSSSASGASDMQEQSLAFQNAMALRNWKRYVKEFVPLEDAMIKEASSPAREQPGFLSAEAQMNRGYADLEANQNKKMAAMYPGGSGVVQGKSDALERARIKDTAGLESNWNAQQWNEMMQAANLGRNLTSQAMQGTSSAASGYGQMANMYGNLASQGAAGFGSMLASPGLSKGINGLISGFSGGSSGSGITSMPSNFMGGSTPTFDISSYLN